jgi:pyocin large subunit-like protein
MRFMADGFFVLLVGVRGAISDRERVPRIGGGMDAEGRIKLSSLDLMTPNIFCPNFLKPLWLLLLGAFS